jgi:hypothetical protein
VFLLPNESIRGVCCLLFWFFGFFVFLFLLPDEFDRSEIRGVARVLPAFNRFDRRRESISSPPPSVGTSMA